MLLNERDSDQLTYTDDHNQKFNILEMDMRNQPKYLLRKVQALRQSQTQSQENLKDPIHIGHGTIYDTFDEVSQTMPTNGGNRSSISTPSMFKLKPSFVVENIKQYKLRGAVPFR